MDIQNTQNSIPLVLALADEPDVASYDEEVRLAKFVTDAYDPVSQTAIVPAEATRRGTSGTVCYKGTGNLLSPDSRYPTDDA